MSTSAQKQSILALSAAAAALASAAQALANESEHSEPVKAPTKVEPPKPEPTKVEPPKPEPVKAAPKPAPVKVSEPEPVKTAPPPATNGSGSVQAECRKAAKAYAEVYGREGLKEVLKKYTEGTLADVSPDKLDSLLKDLS